MIVDYSVYLITGRNLLPPGKLQDYLESLEEALKGGVTIVQIREKDADTREFIDIAKASKKVCDRYNVPVLINDRVDVARAINAHGVHLGQTDMSVSQARALLPEDSIIGVSCNNVQQVKKARQDLADYVGIGAVWGTTTKTLTNPIIGVRGVGEMLEVLDGTNIKAVAIGGIKANNLLRTLHGAVSSTGHTLDGIAVVSEIVSSQNPEVTAACLSKGLHSFRAQMSAIVPRGCVLASGLYDENGRPSKHFAILEGVQTLMTKIRETGPLVHQITNNVVATQSANITLSLGASPIMATDPQEMEDLAHIIGALLVNLGTLTAGTLESMRKAGFYANTFRKPLVLDPVGVGASRFRKETVRELLDTWQASVIKGNPGELAVLAGSNEVQSRGVDSVGPGFKDPVDFVRRLARKERSIVVMTGPIDYISDGVTVVSLSNGDAILGKITGSGCIVGSSIASFCAVASTLAVSKESHGALVSGDMFLGAIAGILVLTIGAEIAVESGNVRGPGTFLGVLIDVLWKLTPEDIAKKAKIDVHVL